MVETRLARANTPGARNAQVTRRASSVPAVGNRKPEWILDCVLMTPRKRKRTSLLEESIPNRASQAQGSRSVRTQHGEQKKTLVRSARTQTRSSTDKDAASSSSRTSSRTRNAARVSPSSSAPMTDSRPKRRAVSASRALSEVPPERASLSQRRRTTSRRDSNAVSKTTAALRKSGPQPASVVSRKAKEKEKGKGRALPEDYEMTTTPSVDDSWSATSSVSGTRGNAKRRRLSPPSSLSLDTTDTTWDGENDSQKTAVEEDFQMFESPDSLPWVPMNPGSKESEYVPPGLNALIEDMKRALVLQISARQKAENLHAEELRRRLELEHEAARLAAANRALEAERSSWTAAAAETLVSNLETALVSDITRRLTIEAFPGPGADAEGLPASAPAPVPFDGLGLGSSSSLGSGPGPGPELQHEVQVEPQLRAQSLPGPGAVMDAEMAEASVVQASGVSTGTGEGTRSGNPHGTTDVPTSGGNGTIAMEV